MDVVTIAPRRRAILEYAILASILLHATVAYLIPAFSGLGAKSAPEFISATRLHPITITVLKPRPVIPPRRALAEVAQPRRPHDFVRPHVTTVARLARATKHSIVHSVTLPTVIAPARSGALASTPSVAPTTTPVATAPSQPQGYMPFGVEQRIPVLDPSVHIALAKLGVHVTLIVTVGDDGHTRTIDFHPPIDASMEAKIRAMLADANWDPSVCGAGLPCQGQATITL